MNTFGGVNSCGRINAWYDCLLHPHELLSQLSSPGILDRPLVPTVQATTTFVFLF